MSKPRPVLPGKSYLITRRCSERRYFLRPSAEVNQVFLYCLAVAATRCAVTVHGFCVLSNHYHLVVTDHEARLPQMMEWLNRELARCLNARLGRWESFWAPGAYSRVELAAEADILSALVYTLVNPVEAGLVPSSNEWPGPRSGTLANGPERITATRPSFYFSKTMPAEVELVIEAPGAASEPDAASEFGRALKGRVLATEQDLRQKHKESDRAFLGVSGVLAQPPSAAPETLEPRRNLSPLLAAKDKRLRLELLEFYADFVRDYREALKEFTAGVRDVLFPPGTYRMRRYVSRELRAGPTVTPGDLSPHPFVVCVRHGRRRLPRARGRRPTGALRRRPRRPARRGARRRCRSRRRRAARRRR